MTELRTDRESNVLAAQVGALVLVVAAVGAFGRDSLAPIAYVVGLGIPALVVLYVALRSTEHRRPWQLLGGGMALWAIGGALVTMQQSADVHGIPGVLIDALYVAGYVPMLMGMVAFAQPAERSGRWVAMMEWILLLTAVYGVLWMVVVEPVALDASQSIYERAGSSIYPAGDLALVLAAWRLVRVRTVRTRVALLLGFGFALSALSDVGLLASHVRHSGGTRSFADFIYLVGCGLLAVGALASTPTSRRSRQQGHAYDSVPMSRAIMAIAVGCPIVWGTATLFDLRSTRVGSLAAWIGGVAVVIGVRALAMRRVAEVEAQRAHWRATHDEATGMYLRPPFMQLASQGGVRERVGTVLRIELIDLRAYSTIDDGQVADALLVEFGKRLRSAMSETSLLARVGFDDFAVFARSSDSSRCGLLAGTVLAAMRDPFECDGVTYELRVEVGVAQTDGAVIDLMAGLRRALQAMRHARTLGPNQFAIDHELAGTTAGADMALVSGTDDRGGLVAVGSTIVR